MNRLQSCSDASQTDNTQTHRTSSKHTPREHRHTEHRQSTHTANTDRQNTDTQRTPPHGQRTSVQRCALMRQEAPYKWNSASSRYTPCNQIYRMIAPVYRGEPGYIRYLKPKDCSRHARSVSNDTKRQRPRHSAACLMTQRDTVLGLQPRVQRNKDTTS